MSVVTEDLNKQKEDRAKQVEDNNAVRKKIQDAIEVYRVKEASYQASMKEYQSKVIDVEKKFKS